MRGQSVAVVAVVSVLALLASIAVAIAAPKVALIEVKGMVCSG